MLSIRAELRDRYERSEQIPDVEKQLCILGLTLCIVYNDLYTLQVRNCSITAVEKCFINMSLARQCLRSHSLRHLLKNHKIPACLYQRTITTDGTTSTTTASPTTSPPPPKKSVVAKVGHATATGSYFIVVSAGAALLGVVVWALASNLFFETRYFSEAVDLIKANPELKKYYSLYAPHLMMLDC